MNSKDIITFTVECSLSTFSSFIDMLESQKDKSNLYDRKIIATNQASRQSGAQPLCCLSFRSNGQLCCDGFYSKTAQSSKHNPQLTCFFKSILSY